jgi:hypothetical protein
MSSEIAPSTSGRPRMKRMPSSTDDSPVAGTGRDEPRGRTKWTMTPVSAKSAALVP